MFLSAISCSQMLCFVVGPEIRPHAPPGVGEPGLDLIQTEARHSSQVFLVLLRRVRVVLVLYEPRLEHSNSRFRQSWGGALSVRADVRGWGNLFKYRTDKRKIKVLRHTGVKILTKLFHKYYITWSILFNITLPFWTQIQRLLQENLQ